MAGFFDNILADPSTAQGMQNAGTFGGLQALGAALAAAGAMRPMGQPGPGLADAFTAYGTGRRQGLLGAQQNAQMARQQARQGLLSEARDANKPDEALSPQALAMRKALSGLGPDIAALADDEQLPGLAIQRATAQMVPMTGAEVAGLGLPAGTVAYKNTFTGAPSVLHQSKLMSPAEYAQAVGIQRAGLQAPAPIILGPGQSAYGRDGRLLASGPTMREQPVTVGPGASLVNPLTGQPVYSSPSNPVTMSPGQSLVDPLTGQPRASVPQNPVTMSPGQSLVDPNTGQPRASLPEKQEPFTLSPGQTRYSGAGQPVVSAGPDPKEGRAVGNDLRGEYTKLTADFRTVQDAFNKIEMAGKTGQGDMALLYGYMKILDPGSVVRESEFATAAKSGSLPQQIQGWATRVVNGEKLPDAVRDGFKNEARNVYQAQAKGYLNTQNIYRDLAVRQGAKPEDVVLPFKMDGVGTAGAGTSTARDPLGILK